MIEIKGLNKRFGGLVALDNLSLSIGPGELFGFIGPNGAGKSTTMKVLAGLLSPDSGSAHVCGIDAVREGERVKRLLGYMPDFLGVYDDLTVHEYLQFFAAAFGIERAKRRSTIDSVLQLTDLTDKQHAMVDSLSRGMQQRLGVARLLLHDPKVLLLDEPASGLDPRARIELRELLLELRRMGKCLMVSSHILSELAEMVTSIGIIERGKLLFAGPVAEAMSRARLGQTIAISLESAGADEPEALSLDRAHALLSSDKRLTGVSREGEQLIVNLADAEDGRPASHHFVLKLLIDSGARIAAFEPRAAKLEDAFLRLTKGVVN
ncbi:MAG: ABC transporter ATP-binding protein [Phycisphaerales bacterium]|nr:ABC transporter ATP-binding protein [Phycisphaeraceae bacterium]